MRVLNLKKYKFPSFSLDTARVHLDMWPCRGPSINLMTPESGESEPIINQTRLKIALAVSFGIILVITIAVAVFSSVSTAPSVGEQPFGGAITGGTEEVGSVAGAPTIAKSLTTPASLSATSPPAPKPNSMWDQMRARFGSPEPPPPAVAVEDVPVQKPFFLQHPFFTRPRKIALFVVIGVILLGAIVTGIVVPIVLRQQSPTITPADDIEGNDEDLRHDYLDFDGNATPNRYWSLVTYFIFLSPVFQAALIAAGAFAIAAVILGMVIMLQGGKFFSMTLFSVLLVAMMIISVICLVIGFWGLAAMSHLVFAAFFSASEVHWFLAGFFVSLIAGIIRMRIGKEKLPLGTKVGENPLAWALNGIFFVLPFAIFAGCMGSIGIIGDNIGRAGAVALFIGAGIVYFFYRRQAKLKVDATSNLFSIAAFICALTALIVIFLGFHVEFLPFFLCILSGILLTVAHELGGLNSNTSLYVPEETEIITTVY